MVRPTALKHWFSVPYIIFELRGLFIRIYVCLVYHCVLHAISIKRAIVCILTLTSNFRCFLLCGFIKNFSVVCFYMRCNVRHTTIINLNASPIYDGVKSMVGWEMFVYEAEERFSYVGFHLKIKRGIVPKDFVFPTACTTSRSRSVFQLGVEA